MPRFIDISGVAPIAASAEARAAINAPGNGGVIVDFTDYGACDGVTDDRAAFATALDVLDTAGGGTLLLPPADIAITMNANPTFLVPANTRIVGTPGATRVLLSSTSIDEYKSFAGNAGDNVHFEGLTFLRNTNCTGMAFFLQGYDGFHVKNCVVNGQRDIYDKTFHGWVLTSDGDKKNITIRDTSVTKVVFGLLQGNVVAGDIDTIVVDNCHFSFNYGDDLEFNAPLSAMTNVLVSNCRFTDMQSTGLAAGLGVGLAGVSGAVVRDCYFDGTFTDAIHLEWDTENVLIANNRFVGCVRNNGETGDALSEGDRATITIQARCRDVIVTGNTIDQRPNTNTIGLHAITLRNYTTASNALTGLPTIPPERVTITDNIILCGENFGGIWACDIADLTVRGNRIIGDGAVTTGVWDGGNIRYGIRVDGINTVLADNAVSGFRFGITGPLVEDSNGVGGVSLQLSERRALGNPGTVSGNLFSDCYIGIVAVPAGAVTLHNNRIFNCVRPMVVGDNAYAAETCSIIGNFATNCVYQMEIGGRHIVQRSAGGSTVTVGASKTVDVDETLLKLPIGTVITFSGGGVLTLTAAETGTQLYTSGSPYALAGTVSVADIAADEYGVITGLAHSSTSANNFPFSSDLTVGESIFPREQATSTTITSVNNVVRLTFFTAKQTETINSVRTVTGTTAGVSPTLCRIGIYQVSATGTLTLVASTANDTSLWVAANTVYTKSLSASFSKVAGQRYAVAILVVGSSTAPTFQGSLIPSNDIAAYDPPLALYAGGPSDLLASFATGGLSKAGNRIYAALLP